MRRRIARHRAAAERNQRFAEFDEEERLRSMPPPSDAQLVQADAGAVLGDGNPDDMTEREVRYSLVWTRRRWAARYHYFVALSNRQRNADGLVVCACCKQTSFNGIVFSPGDLECDHIQELADDGSDDLDNLQLLCAICHRRKTRHFQKRRVHLSRLAATVEVPPCPGVECAGCYRRDCRNPRPLSEYEIERLETIARNNEELSRLGLL